MVTRSCGFSVIAFASTVHANPVCVRVNLISHDLDTAALITGRRPTSLSGDRRWIDGRSEQYKLKFKTCVPKGSSVPQVPGSILYTIHLALIVQKQATFTF